MFIAHITGWNYKDLMKMDGNELAMWYDKAVSLHNHLNAPPEE